jgi:hypothetical protein
VEVIVKSKILGIIILTITFLGLAGSTASLFLDHASHGLAFYITNYAGDLLVLIGGIKLVKNNVKGRPFVYIGSLLFGLAGIISMSYSMFGGAVTVLISLTFILLVKSVRFN